VVNRGSLNLPGSEDQTACTMDAKECPDGSFVGRVGPNCEFAACPNGNNQCDGELTPQLTEGPYYRSGSPERVDLRESGIVGESIRITGYVYDTNCQPISRAWLDFWQADGQGVYDNLGYQLRGHQYTDKDGKYILETVMPARYSGRTPHIHVKVKASEGSHTLTTQLFFPGEAQNMQDSIFNEDLVVNMGRFNFVVNVN